MEKQNIRKAIALKRLEHKKKYKALTGAAIDLGYKDSQNIREAENKEWKKFMFYNGLMEATDYLKEHENENENKNMESK